MRTLPPHPLIRFRVALLVTALAALASAAIVLGLYKGSSTFPVAQVVAAGGILFVWLSFAFWLVELRYPHIQVGPSMYASRAEQASSSMHSYSNGFFVAYGIAAAFITVACLRVATYA